MKTVIVAVALAFGFSAQAMDAQISVQAISEPTRFERMYRVMENLCEISPRNTDCGVQVYKVSFSAPGAMSWEKAIQKALKEDHIQNLNVGKVLKNQVDVTNAFKDVAAAAGIERSDLPFLNAWEGLLSALDYDVFNQSISQVHAGSLSGEFGLQHQFVVFVDRQNLELIVLRAGYSD